jgi:hypothetical protein
VVFERRFDGMNEWLDRGLTERLLLVLFLS